MEELLNEAVELHRSGRLHDAGRAYQALLRLHPDDPDVLHLMGVALHQLGRSRSAAELIGRAIVLRPSAAEFHANLAEVHRALGLFEQATAGGREALRLRPDYPEAANNLGLALQERGQVDEAIEQFRVALSLRPDFADAHNNLADALRGRGDLDGALEHFQDAVRIDPQRADLRSNLGNLLRSLGRIDEARRHLAAAVRLAPRSAAVHENVAQMHRDEGRHDEAVAWYERALTYSPESAQLHCRLADVLVEVRRFDEAAKHLQAALRLFPRCAEAHDGLGVVRREQGRNEEALERFRNALALDSGLVSAHCHLGELLAELNDLPGAQAALREALRHEPGCIAALGQLATLLRGRLPDEDLDVMRSLLAKPSHGEMEDAGLHFGMAQVLDARGEYAEAAAHLREANARSLAVARRRGDPYDPDRHAAFVAEMIAACSPAFFERVRGLGLGSERPVFVFGLPRSGTTLVEQILASHSQVFGAGELLLARQGFDDLPVVMNSSESPIVCLRGLDAEAASIVGRRHLDQLNSLDARAPRIVDKLPDNYLYLGLLAAIFPRARFIHCRRDLRDVAVSCWMTHFRRIRWADDPGYIASRFVEYERLMQHWRAVLPTPMLEIQYEKTVADLEHTARRLIEWCGVEWEPACLEFHKSPRPVRTASIAQVRQPLYTKSVARWRHYEAALDDLFAKLPQVPDSDR